MQKKNMYSDSPFHLRVKAFDRRCVNYDIAYLYLPGGPHESVT